MATPIAPAATLLHSRSALPTSSSHAFSSTTTTCACLRSFQRPLARPAPLLHRKFATLGGLTTTTTTTTTRPAAIGRRRSGMICRAAGLEALVFDCDGVILESEDLHRRAYNAAFHHFHVRTPASPPDAPPDASPDAPDAPDAAADAVDADDSEEQASSSGVLEWKQEFYDVFQNTVGGGKPKMRWYFAKHGWPTSTILPSAPSSEEEQAILIDTIQDWKTEKYKNFISSGDVETRPGVLRLMDASRKSGLKLAVCSAATKSSVVFTLSNLLGKERFEGLDYFLAGDDVDKKKPDPTIYIKAAQALGVAPENCLVIEDSIIGLKAAVGAGMSCIISYTSSTSTQDFSAAKAVYPDLGSVRLEDLIELLQDTPVSL